jgi:hypothetical protein
MQCQICDSEEAVFTVIPTGEGLPEILGPVCFARAGLDLAKEILPAEEIAQILGPMFVNPEDRPDLKEAHKATIRGRKSKADQAEPKEGPTGGRDAESPAAADQ